MNQGTSFQSNIFVVQTAIKKWGNSQGIRLSKEITKRMNLHENDMVDLSVDTENGRIIIEKTCRPKYSDLKERLEAFYNKPLDDIYVESDQDEDMGAPVGDEI